MGRSGEKKCEVKVLGTPSCFSILEDEENDDMGNDEEVESEESEIAEEQKEGRDKK